MKKISKFVIKLFSAVISFYNTWYGVINLIIGLVLLTKFNSDIAMILICVFTGIDVYRWYKGIFKNLSTRSNLLATVKENNVLCIVGGIGSGKSTLGQFLLNRLIAPNMQYYNTFNKGKKSFTWNHLLLKHKLESPCGVFIDEAGAMMDSFHYSKEDTPVRKRAELFNKFFRQFYGSNSYCFYIDQSQANMNTSFYKNIYYYIQCKSLEVKPSCLLLNWFISIPLFWLNRKRLVKINNPFSNCHLTFYEFNVLGDYAEHYSVNIDEKNMKVLVTPILKMFGSLDTYVFRKFNPAEVRPQYTWGTDEQQDNQIMEDNFNLKALQENITNTFVNKKNS